jgi:hypothetical protein
MSEEDVRLALEPFSQGGNARGVKGTGLGSPWSNGSRNCMAGRSTSARPSAKARACP